MSVEALLQKTIIFKELPAAELSKLAAVAKTEHRTAENIIFREGDPGTHMYVIVLGSVGVLKRNAGGADEEVAQLASGSYFGEMAVVDDLHERSATIVTKEATELLAFKKKDVEALFERDDKLAHHFYRALSRGLARRLRATTQDSAFYRTLAKQRHG